MMETMIPPQVGMRLRIMRERKNKKIKKEKKRKKRRKKEKRKKKKEREKERKKKINKERRGIVSILYHTCASK